MPLASCSPRLGLAAVLIVVVLAACSPALPVVVVDDEHYQALSVGPVPLAYKVAPGPGFTLVATGYPFLIPASAPEAPGPNMIQVIGSDEQVYSHPWDMQQTVYDLTPATLTHAETGEPFPGLEPGVNYLVGVGYLDATGRFVVLWAGLVEVQAR